MRKPHRSGRRGVDHSAWYSCLPRLLVGSAAFLGILVPGMACRTVSIVDVLADFVFQLEVRDEANRPVLPFSLKFADVSLSERPGDLIGWEVLPVATIDDPGPVRLTFTYSWSETWTRGKPTPRSHPEREILVIVEAEGYQRWSSRISILELPRDPAGRTIVDLGRVRLAGDR